MRNHGSYMELLDPSEMIPLAFFDFGESAVLDVIGWIVSSSTELVMVGQQILDDSCFDNHTT